MSSAPPILPVEGKRNVMITSALPYVNNVPHLGNLVGAILSADVFARFCRLRGYNTIYICGTDEYGTATETKALSEGVTPQEICDRYHRIHSEIYQWFGISFDHFGRTTTQQQTQIAQDIFLKLYQRNLLTKDIVQQLYCEHCKRFLADRFIVGTCPSCSSTGARGDQCDICARLLTPQELLQPRCKVCNGNQIVEKSSEHLFLDLPSLTERLNTWAEQSFAKGAWSPNGVSITRTWIENGLKPRCITRDLKWGTPVPLEEYKDKVFYVWFDAPIGYISITANYATEWEQWWKNAENVELIQFMGKDNVPFHSVIFPASLIGTDDPWTLVNHISTCEYLNYEGRKFSKTDNIGVFGDSAKTTGIPAEVWRYYLMSNRPEQSDSNFSWDDFRAKNDAELIGHFGNYVNRSLKFVSANFGGQVPGVESPLTENDQRFIDEVNTLVQHYVTSLDAVHLKDALHDAIAISRLGNQFLQVNQGWVLIKENKPRCATVYAIATNLSYLLATLVHPFMPQTSEKLLQQLNSSLGSLEGDAARFDLSAVPAGHSLSEVTTLFRSISEEQIEELRSRFSGGSPTASSSSSTAAATATKKPAPQPKKKAGAAPSFAFDLRVGLITEVNVHPESDKLFVLRVDLGEAQPRQVVAGVQQYYKSDELLNRRVVVLANLAAANLVGVESQGMCLAASWGKETTELALIAPPDDAAPGTPVVALGASSESRENLLTRKDVQKVKLKVVAAHAAVFSHGGKNFPLVLATDNRPVVAPGAPENAAVK